MKPKLILGSVLDELKGLQANSVDTVITSPPYANRYDYSRTYALELAYLGFDNDRIKRLRQDLLSATVENRSKRGQLIESYCGSEIVNAALRGVDQQDALHEALLVLRQHHRELGNPHVIRLLENYFTEMAVVIHELGRVLKPTGNVFMVNDNVRYHGEEVPVDLILADLAESAGFRCEKIWVLKRGKGNSSQQMGRFGRQEIRKCVYHWVRSDE